MPKRQDMVRQRQILHVEFGDDAEALALEVLPRLHGRRCNDHRAIGRRGCDDDVADPGRIVADRAGILIVSGIEIADRHHLVGTHIVPAYEIDLQAVFVPDLQVLVHEGLDVVVSRRACDQLDLVVIAENGA
jgi:hypothetical protein